MARRLAGFGSHSAPHPACHPQANRGKVGARGRRVDLNAFIDRWTDARGGAERANYQMFLSELCEALDLPRPDPASDDTRT